MSVWFKDDGLLFLRESAVQIAWDFLERAGEIDDSTETSHFGLRVLCSAKSQK